MTESEPGVLLRTCRHFTTRLQHLRGSQIARNAAWLTVGSVYSQLAGGLFLLLLARALGPESLGVFSTGQAFTAVAFLFASLGLPIWIKREAARDRSASGRYWATGIVISALASLAVLLVSVILIRVMPYGPRTRLVTCLFCAVSFLELQSSLCVAVAHAHERMDLDSKVLILIGTLKLIGGAFLLVQGYGLVTIVVWLIILSALKFGALLWTIGTRVGVDFSVPVWSNVVAVFRETVPIGLGTVLGTMNYRAGTVMLSALDTQEAVGLYSAGYGLFMLMALGPPTIVSAVFPRLAAYYPVARRKAWVLYRDTQALSLLAGLVAGVGLWLGGGVLLPIVYGQAFERALPVFFWLGLAVPFLFLRSMSSVTLNVINLQGLNFRLAAVMVGLNFLASVLLIPRLSFVGAAIATLISYSAGTVLTAVPAIRALRTQSVRC
jgi:O-antigen/teichoic acid export membrane protein